MIGKLRKEKKRILKTILKKFLKTKFEESDLLDFGQHLNDLSAITS